MDAELELGRRLIPTFLEKWDDAERRVPRKPTLFRFPCFERDAELNEVWIHAQAFPACSVKDKYLKWD